jgi:hypothetical protein
VHDNYFIHKWNAAGILGLSCLQMVVATFQMIAYGVAVNATNDYVCIGESNDLECLTSFAIVVVEVFGSKYMRLPNEQDSTMLYAIGESRGFLDMLGSMIAYLGGVKFFPPHGTICTWVIRRLQLY